MSLYNIECDDIVLTREALKSNVSTLVFAQQLMNGALNELRYRHKNEDERSAGVAYGALSLAEQAIVKPLLKLS
mgnify:CR=1 FL=1